MSPLKNGVKNQQNKNGSWTNKEAGCGLKKKKREKKKWMRDGCIYGKVKVCRGFGVHRCWGAPPMHIHYAPPPRSVASSRLNGCAAESSCCRSVCSASPSVCYIHFISPLLASVWLIHRLLLWWDDEYSILSMLQFDSLNVWSSFEVWGWVSV